MDKQEELITQVVGVLNKMDTPYMIGGSVALSVWAVPRTTHDIDVVVDLPEDRIIEFCAQFPQDRFFIDADVMQVAFRHRDTPSLGMYSFSDLESGIKVDLFPLRPSDEAQQMALARREWVELLPQLRTAVCSPDDLLIQKLRWYTMSESERQFRDCVNLIMTDRKLAKPLIDWAYVQDWVTRLGPSVEASWASLKNTIDEVLLDNDSR